MPISKGKRFGILRRDSFTCQYCGRRPPMVILHVDHRVSIKDGGNDHNSNLVAACRDCNLGKSATSVLMVLGVRHDLDFERRILAAVEDAHDRTFNRYLIHRGEDGRQELMEDAAESAEFVKAGPSEWYENHEELVGL